MAEDSEKRFHSIMDKLFQSPRSIQKASSSPSSSSGMQSFRGRKRPNPTSASALLDPKSGLDVAEEVQHSSGMSQAPLCRPWDRNDLMGRLSTFKSMTWFAKPKAVSAVNCARRGWVNVDMDTIACEACGARVLFTTSSSWSQEQVEKAALVFSLKLDNGHNFLCPWINNTCDETLAQFPPTSPSVLADQFRERSSLLARLLALPVISSSAIEFMRSPQLDQFLQQSSLLEFGDASPGIPSMEYQENGRDLQSADLYYQALKLISLCGWEPRVLPFVVDRKMDLSNQTAGEANVSKCSRVLREREKSIVCIPSSDISSETEANRNFGSLNESVADPNSVVLDCMLCGASVGLWAFSTVSRPIEVYRLVGFTGTNDEDNGSREDTVNGDHSNRILAIKANAPSSNTNLTIAGGPPPTQQNFKATISLPIIGRSIRARFSSDPSLRTHLLVNQKECNNANGDISAKQPTSLSNNPAEGSKKDDEVMEGVEGTSSHPNNSSEQGNSQNDVQVLGQNETSGTLANSNEKTSASVVASDEAGDKKTPEVTVRCSGDETLDKIAGEESPVVHGKHTTLRAADKVMEFDPIRQHRHFCPWIPSTGGVVPGWQQVLSALQRQKDVSQLSPTSPPTSSLIKVDDPITSVRRLFMSKRMKQSQASS